MIKRASTGAYILGLAALATTILFACWGGHGKDVETTPSNIRHPFSHRSRSLGEWEHAGTFTCPNGDLADLKHNEGTSSYYYDDCEEKVEIGNLRFWSMAANHIVSVGKMEPKGFEMFAVCGLGSDFFNLIENEVQDFSGSDKILKGNDDFAYAEFAICQDGSSPGVVLVKNSQNSYKLSRGLVEDLDCLKNTNCAMEGLVRYKLWELIEENSVDQNNWPVHITAKLVRMIFHDVFDFRNVVDAQGNTPASYVGGGDFCLLTPPNDFGMNFGMQSRDQIDAFVQSTKDGLLYDHDLLWHLTMADVIALGAEVGIDKHDGPSIGGFKSGRKVGDCAYPICFEDQCAENPYFLDMAPSSSTFEQSDNYAVFNKLGFNEQQEIVALLGAHTLGGTNWGITARGDFCPLLSQPYDHDTNFDNTILADPDVNKNFLGAWFDTTPGVFDVDFFRLLQTMPGRPAEEPWQQEIDADDNNDDDDQLLEQEIIDGSVVLGSTVITHYDKLIEAMNGLDLVNCLDEVGTQLQDSPKCQLGFLDPFTLEELSETAVEQYSMHMWCKYCEKNEADDACLPEEEIRAGGLHISNKVLDGGYQTMPVAGSPSNLLVRKVAAFHSDLAMSWDESSREWIDAFARDQDLFFAEFIKVFHKMQEMTPSSLNSCSAVACQIEGAQDEPKELKCSVHEEAAAGQDALIFTDCETEPGIDLNSGNVCWLRELKGLDLGVFDCSGAVVECYIGDYPSDF
mmetsp:Transcript_66418/g.152053  ORF Transcript_66418/g.152053 Transcript_66418/m.152053 type:complete len:738 (+) Transcript_66418:173-2386(+)